MLLGAATWAMLGLLVGLALLAVVRLGLTGLILASSVPGGLIGATTLGGAIIGAINGFALGVVVLAAERGHAVERIPWWRFGLWGAAATAATAWLLSRNPLIAAVCAVLGGGAGIAALAIARRPVVTRAGDA